MGAILGGLTNIAFIPIIDIASYSVFAGCCKIKLKSGKSWIKIPSGMYGVTASAVPSATSAGTLYTISAIINVPKKHVTADLIIKISRLAKQKLVMSYDIFDKTRNVLGSTCFPVELIFENITPASVTGFQGLRITVSGKQPHPEFVLDNE